MQTTSKRRRVLAGMRVKPHIYLKLYVNWLVEYCIFSKVMTTVSKVESLKILLQMYTDITNRLIWVRSFFSSTKSNYSPNTTFFCYEFFETRKFFLGNKTKTKKVSDSDCFPCSSDQLARKMVELFEHFAHFVLVDMLF